MEIWEDWEEGNCLEGRRRRLMRRGTRATREEGGEGERGEGREEESSFLLVVEKALLLVAAVVLVVVVLRFVCLDKAIPLERWIATRAVSKHSRSPRRSLFKSDFSEENPLILYVHRYVVDQKRARERGIIFVSDFCSSLSEFAACSTCPLSLPQTTENNGYHRKHVIHTRDRLGRSSTWNISVMGVEIERYINACHSRKLAVNLQFSYPLAQFNFLNLSGRGFLGENQSPGATRSDSYPPEGQEQR